MTKRPKFENGIARCDFNCPKLLIETGECKSTAELAAIGGVCIPWLLELMQYADSMAYALEEGQHKKAGRIMPVSSLVNSYNQWRKGK